MKLEYKALKEKVKEINKKDAKFYGNMFAKLNKQDSSNSAVSGRLYNNSLTSSFTSCSFIDSLMALFNVELCSQGTRADEH